MKSRKKSYHELDNALFIVNMCLCIKKNFEKENLKSRTKASKRKKKINDKKNRVLVFSGPRPQFVFDGPGPKLVFHGPCPQFVFTDPGPQFVFACYSLYS